MRLAAGLLIFAVLTGPGMTVLPDEILDDPALEARARTISKDLRCLVCQNQSIDDSDAGLARDLRLIVRERLLAGDTDEQAKDHIVARYGEFVLLTPTFNAATFLLWTGPIIILLVGIVAAVASFRRHGRRAPDGDSGPPRKRQCLPPGRNDGGSKKRDSPS